MEKGSHAAIRYYKNLVTPTEQALETTLPPFNARVFHAQNQNSPDWANRTVLHGCQIMKLLVTGIFLLLFAAFYEAAKI